ncbi:MAG: TetR family transcriptional regulator [Microbacterium sp.]
MSSMDAADPRSDQRWVRAHAALREAALRLASETPLDELSLTAVAGAAGVSRSTAYDHAPTARALVEEALLEELDALRDLYLVGITPDETPAATSTVTREVIAHVVRHGAIYRRGLAPGAGAGSLHGMLAAQFATSVYALLDAHDIDPGIPARNARTQAAIDDIIVRGIADGTVGQLAAWLQLPEPRDPELFLAVNARLLPAWWRQP